MQLFWKKNINKIPQSINQNLKTEFINVAATKKIPLTDIGAGIYFHVGLSITNGTVVANSPILKRRDGEMVTKEH